MNISEIQPEITENVIICFFGSLASTMSHIFNPVYESLYVLM